MLRLKTVRRNAKMTQKVLAARTGITREYLSAIENNSKLPSLVLLQKLAAALGAEISELFCDGTAAGTGKPGNNDKGESR